MKRSEINGILREADAFIASFRVTLPPFAYWTPVQMRERRAAIGGIVDGRLGWDVTDYGKGDFASTGLFLFTLRNGNAANLASGGGMLYAEKLLVSRRGQVAPMHRHAVKAEEIINRGGGTLALQLYLSAADGSIDRTATVRVRTDGIVRQLDPGGVLQLAPGESVTLLPGVWHAFWAEADDVLIGEVSTVNDDLTDNVFAEPLPRFASIEDDEEPLHLLVSDYPRWLDRDV